MVDVITISTNFYHFFFDINSGNHFGAPFKHLIPEWLFREDDDDSLPRDLPVYRLPTPSIGMATKDPKLEAYTGANKTSIENWLSLFEVVLTALNLTSNNDRVIKLMSYVSADALDF